MAAVFEDAALKSARFGSAVLGVASDLEELVAGLDDRKKSRARLASPQPRPTSPVNGAGGNNRLPGLRLGTKVVPNRPQLFLHTVK